MLETEKRRLAFFALLAHAPVWPTCRHTRIKPADLVKHRVGTLGNPASLRAISKVIPYLLLVLAHCAWVPSTHAQETWPAAGDVAKAQYPNDLAKRFAQKLNAIITAKFAITTKGNGSLELPGLGVRVYDRHDDGVMYKNGLLRCTWSDSLGNGILELAVEGVAEFSDERAQKAGSERIIRSLFRYIPDQRRFAVIYCDSEIYCWERP